jgi:hypothetical protein
MITSPRRRRARDRRIREAAGDGCSGEVEWACILLTGGIFDGTCSEGPALSAQVVELRGCLSLFAAIRLIMMGKKMGRKERLYRKPLILKY